MIANPDTCFNAGKQWERFAEADPYRYILTDAKRGDPQAFWESGERLVRSELVPLVRDRSIQTNLALEIGSGIGRLTLPLASYFRSTVGVDIAPGMVRKAIACARDNGIPNTSFLLISGPEDFLRRAGHYLGRCDLVYSLLVFQHIPALSMIEDYLHVVRSLLCAKGIAYLQFDTRPATFLYRIKTELPDFLLPRFWRRGIRRIRRTTPEITECLHRTGLEIVDEAAPATSYHRYVVRISGHS